METSSKKITYRRWALVNTFMLLVMLGLILTVGSNRGDVIFRISAPLSLAIFGTFMVDHLLNYFECVTHVKDTDTEEINKE